MFDALKSIDSMPKSIFILTSGNSLAQKIIFLLVDVYTVKTSFHKRDIVICFKIVIVYNSSICTIMFSRYVMI